MGSQAGKGLAFLFDLDMTLVDSSAIAHLRAAKLWPQVMGSLDKVVAFDLDPAPHEIPAKLRALGYKVAVVTSSPKNYAEAVLEQFSVEYDVLVSYHDTTEHKPDPAPLKHALEQLGVDADDAVHVGDHVIDVEASHHAGVASVGAGWGVEDLDELARAAPDVLLFEPSPLLAPAKLARRRYVAERVIDGKDVDWHRGSALPCDDSERLSTLGRYFTSGDPRHASSKLSSDLLTFKVSDAPAKTLAKALALFIENLDWKTPFVVTSVPPKPGQTRDRFKALFDELKPLLPKGVTIVPGGLKCVRDIPDYKKKGLHERKAAVDGAYETEYDWKGFRVLLVDDVHTTGSTCEECASALKAAGAEDVHIVCFAKDQHSLDAPETCPRCGLPLKVRTNRKDDSKFWGCSGWKKGGGGCDYTRSF
jgi:HAD superfamily hydrolase (TIGR01549 family)